MFQLVESLRIEDRMLHHVDLHNRRLNNARRKVFGIKKPVDLNQVIQLPELMEKVRYKCRVVTNGQEISFEISLYHQREIKSLKLVHVNNIDYTYKTDRREMLDKAFAERGSCDDIIIVKNKYLTDAWAANIILFDGKAWVTPSTPLLKGIQREFLLSKGLIAEEKIHYESLHKYQKIKLINAMIDFERAPEIDTTTIMTTNY